MAADLIGRTISHYEIESLLGRGAMGEVYLARDTRLDCPRALKFLHWPAGVDSEERARLLAEARAAAALNHPGICTVHEIDEAEGRLFIVMEHVPGEDLADRIARGPLPPAEALRIVGALAEALRAAHAQGVVHRDIKPGNIRIAPTGAVKLMDFGLAIRSGSGTLTQPESTAGTPIYMAPEQARGEAVDVRSDLWSLGVVLHEMLAGEPPWSATHELATLYSICNEAPRPLPPLRGAPEGLPALVEHCLEKDPERRVPDAETMLAEIAQMDESKRPGRGLLAGWLRLLPAALIAVLALSLPLDWWRGCSVPRDGRVLALLPLEVIGGGERDRALAAGLVQHLTAQLMRVERFQTRLAVVPACDVEDSDVDSSRDARRIFGANLVVAGSLLPLDDAITLTLNLIDPVEPRLLGAAEFAVPRGEALRLRSESLSSLIRMLSLRLDANEQGMLIAGEEPEPAVFSDYLAGLGYLSNLEQHTYPLRLARVDSALAIFERAAATDPQFAGAQAGCAQAAWARYLLTRDEAWSRKALAAGEAALAIEPGHLEGLLARGRIRAGLGEYERAVTDFRAVLERDSLDVRARRELASAYEAMGDTRGAEEAYRAAIAMRPSDYVTLKQLGIFYYHQGRHAEAIAAFEQLLAATPENTWLGHNQLGGIHYQMGDIERAEAAFEASLAIAPNYRGYANLGTVRHMQGDYAAAVELRRAALELHEQDDRVWGALAASLIKLPDRREEAMAAYRQSAELAEARWRVNPRDVRVLARLAGYYVVLDDSERALRLLEDARRAGPIDVESLAQIGHTLEKLGRREEALDCLLEAVERGYSVKKIEQETTLRELRADPRWSARLIR